MSDLLEVAGRTQQIPMLLEGLPRARDARQAGRLAPRRAPQFSRALSARPRGPDGPNPRARHRHRMALATRDDAVDERGVEVHGGAPSVDARGQQDQRLELCLRRGR